MELTGYFNFSSPATTHAVDILNPLVVAIKIPIV